MSCSNVSVSPTCTAAVRCRLVYTFFSLLPADLYLHPHEGETIGQKLNRLSLAIMSKHRSPINPPDRDDCLLATHPSDHNAVYVDTVSHKGREKRLSKTRRRKERDMEKLKQGKLDEKLYNRGLDHTVAFLVPVPMYYGYGIPGAACSGIAGGFGAGCASVSGFLSRHLFCVFLIVASIGPRRVRGRRELWC